MRITSILDIAVCSQLESAHTDPAGRVRRVEEGLTVHRHTAAPFPGGDMRRALRLCTSRCVLRWRRSAH